jgi:hypothetical protein
MKRARNILRPDSESSMSVLFESKVFRENIISFYGISFIFLQTSHIFDVFFNEECLWGVTTRQSFIKSWFLDRIQKGLDESFRNPVSEHV